MPTTHCRDQASSAVVHDPRSGERLGSTDETRSARLVLQAAAPGLRVSSLADPWHGSHARADLPHAPAVQFAYLFAEGDGVRLSLYPADTLTQARVFYDDDARQSATLFSRARRPPLGLAWIACQSLSPRRTS